MKHSLKLFSLFLIVALFGILASACTANINRNADGSLTVESTMTEESLQSEIQAAIADPLVQNLTVQLEQGYINVSAERKRLNSDQTDALTFRIDLGVNNGNLTATISNAMVDGKALEADRVALWNERIANRLANFNQRRPNSTLQSVNVTSEAVTMTWRIETGRSQNN